MLSIQNISKSFGVETILSQVTFTLNPGEKIGLVGPNGCGKTTLLRILAGEIKPDSGSVRFDPFGLRPGYLPQGFNFNPQETLGEFLNRMEGGSQQLAERLEVLSLELARNPNQTLLQNEFDQTLAQLALADESAGQAETVLASLGLSDLPRELSVTKLSGGQKTRLGLAGVLMSGSPLLLLDEPTNHLDFDMLEWLEDWLLESRQAVLIVSHDRAFLDNVATSILELDPLSHSTHLYSGNYTDYQEQKEAEVNRQWSAYKDQQAEIHQMQQDIIRVKAQAAYTERQSSSIRIGGPEMKIKGFKDYQRSIAKAVARKAKSREHKLERYLESEERVEKPQRIWQMKIEFGDTPESGRDVLVLDQLSVGYNGLALLENINLIARFGRRIVLVGPNGCGKSTLLRTVTGTLEPIKGRIHLGSGVRVGYMAQEQETLDPTQTPLSTLNRLMSQNETAVRSFLSKYRFTGDDVFLPVSRLSYGERARLSLACLVAQGCNFLILDEPINHLDIPSRARFEDSLTQFEGTVLAVVHDRYFIESFASEIWEVQDKTIRVVK